MAEQSFKSPYQMAADRNKYREMMIELFEYILNEKDKLENENTYTEHEECVKYGKIYAYEDVLDKMNKLVKGE